MRAAVIRRVGVVEVVDLPEPEPGDREVVVEVGAVGVCGTDLHILGGEFAPSLPVVPGHEFAGTVVALGPGVEPGSGVAVGDRVAVSPELYCTECRFCRQGRFNLCEISGGRGIGVSRNGAAAERVAVPAVNCVVLPDHVRTTDAILIEPLSCVVHGYDVIGARLGSRVLVLGAGTAGLMLAQLAPRAGAASVDVVDLDPAKHAAAAAAGATRTARRASELDDGRGWDVVIDATGVPAAIEDGLSRVARGGTYLQFGVAPTQARVDIEPYRVFSEEITITGSLAVLHSYERAAELFFAGAIDPQLYLTHSVGLEDYAEALELVRSGVARKVHVLPTKGETSWSS